MKNKNGLISFLCIIFLFALHLPFLNADPDYNLSIGRDAFTDEGLNTSQLRNYINSGILSFSESDNLIKTPLFNLILFLPLSIFGTHLNVARLTVLLFVLLIYFLLLKNEFFRKLFPFLLITTLTQYYVFQYSHFSLSEIISIAFILATIFSILMLYEKQNHNYLWIAALLLSAAYFSKIQFVYIIVLLPASVFILEYQNHNSLLKATVSGLFPKAIIMLALFLFTYILVWLVPNWEVFKLVMNEESGGKYDIVKNIPKTIAFNIAHVLFSKQSFLFNTLVVVCLIAGTIAYRKSNEKQFKVLFILSLLWMLIEMNKLSMIYLPSRYLLSYYFSAGLMSSIVIEYLFRNAFGSKNVKSVQLIIASVLIASFLTLNTVQYIKLLTARQYKIESINQYMASAMKNTTQPILGPWSTNAAWDSKVRSLPVWRDFMNDKNVVGQFLPQAILSEPDEEESNQAYSSAGINLATISDSSRSFEIGRWNVIVYWIKAE